MLNKITNPNKKSHQHPQPKQTQIRNNPPTIFDFIKINITNIPYDKRQFFKQQSIPQNRKRHHQKSQKNRTQSQLAR